MGERYLDSFICDVTPEEYEDFYVSDDMWFDIQMNFCKEMNIEMECYED